MEKTAFKPTSLLNRMRYTRYKVLGMTLEDIASEDKVTTRVVERSIRLVEMQNVLYGLESLERGQSEVVLHNKELEKATIQDALTAERKVYIETGPKAGTVLTTEPDYDTRLRAAEVLTEKAKAVFTLHTKGGNQTNVNLGVNVNNTTNIGTTYEEKLRDVLKKRTPSVQNGLPASGGVIDIVAEKSENDSIAGNP